MKRELLIEGFNELEIAELSKSEEFQAIVFSDEPVIFKAGTSEILGQLKKGDTKLEITFSHITGGGEGVLLKLMNLFRQFAKKDQKKKIIWIVHAVDCPKPNPKLPRILAMKGFEIVEDPIDGKVYKKMEFLK